MPRCKILLLVLGLLASRITLAQNSDSLQLARAAESFLKAFTSFDWETFRNAYSKEATMFFPIWDHRERKTGKAELEAAWLHVFPEFIDTANRFDFRIEPQNLLIQAYNNTGIVTFQFGDEEYLSRRTLVFVKEGGEWKIVHMHASGVKKPAN